MLHLWCTVTGSKWITEVHPYLFLWVIFHQDSVLWVWGSKVKSMGYIVLSSIMDDISLFNGMEFKLIYSLMISGLIYWYFVYWRQICVISKVDKIYFVVCDVMNRVRLYAFIDVWVWIKIYCTNKLIYKKRFCPLNFKMQVLCSFIVTCFKWIT